MYTFNKTLWTAEAQKAWSRWWSEQLTIRHMPVAELAVASYMAGESADSWRNTLDSMIKGDIVGIQRVFSPTRKTKFGPEVRLPKLCAALSSKGAKVTVDDLWEQLEKTHMGRSNVVAAANPWHAAFLDVDAGEVVVPAALPLPVGREFAADAAAPATAWARLISKSVASSRIRSTWVWVTGEPGSGRRYAAREIASQCADMCPGALFEVVMDDPAGGWSRLRASRPGTRFVAVVAAVPAERDGFDRNDIEVTTRPWTSVELKACAAKLLQVQRISALDCAKVDDFANRAKDDPELLGPDKRPVAVIQLLAEILRGDIPTTPGAVRRALRAASWAKTSALLPEGHYLKGTGQALMRQLWESSIANATDGVWWRMTRPAAEAHLANERGSATGLSAAQQIDGLLRQLDQERSKEKRKALSEQVSRLAHHGGNVLVEALIQAGCLVEREGHVGPADRTSALLDAASALPNSIATPVLTDFSNLELAREWGVVDHEIGKVVAMMLRCPGHARPFAWRWILEFAWARRAQLTDDQVRRYLVPAWAGVLLAEIHGYGDMAVHSWTVGQRGVNDTLTFLRQMSLHWSGVLPDLEPERPFAGLKELVSVEDLARLERWLAFRVSLALDMPDGLSPAQWLPAALVGAMRYAFSEYSNADPARLAEYADRMLWSLAPGQLLALEPGAVTDLGLEEWQEGLKDRVKCQASRAERGDDAARAWMAGQHISSGDTDGDDPVHDPKQQWSMVPIADRLKWLRLRASGEAREVALLETCFRVGYHTEIPKLAGYWSDFCAILERQHGDQLALRVAELALPWRPQWRELGFVTIDDGLRLAERFGFAEILVQALEAPQRWLNLQQAARVRGEVRLAAPWVDRREDNRLSKQFWSDWSTWAGLEKAEAFASAAAVALYRLGHPEHLLRRWSMPPEWELLQSLRAQLAVVGHYQIGREFELDERSSLPFEAETVAAALEWLQRAASPDKHGLISSWTGNSPGDNAFSLWQELGLLLKLAIAPGRFDIAGRDLSRQYHDDGDKPNPSRRFWRWASSPRELDLDQAARLPHIMAHALRLWTLPPLATPLAQWFDGLEVSRPGFVSWRLRDEVSVVPWDDDPYLRNLAHTRIERDVGELLALGDDTPLRAWVQTLGKEQSESFNWFSSAQDGAVKAAVLGGESVAVQAFRLALQAPREPVEEWRSPVDCLLDTLTRAWKQAKVPVPEWLLRQLATAPTAVALRFLRGGDPPHDKRYLPLLRSLLDNCDNLTTRLWCARAIRALEPTDPRLAPLVLHWLDESLEPFVGPGSLDYGILRTPPRGGYVDIVAACVELWRAGQLPEASLRKALHRFSGLLPTELPGTEDANSSAFHSDSVVRDVRELRVGLELCCNHLLQLALDLQDRVLAHRAIRLPGRMPEYRRADIRLAFATGEELLAVMEGAAAVQGEGLHDLIGPEDAAMRLARKPEYADRVRDFAQRHLQRLLADLSENRQIAHDLLIFQRLGEDAWLDALALVPSSMTAMVLAETVAMGWDRPRSDEHINRVLPLVVDMETAHQS